MFNPVQVQPLPDFYVGQGFWGEGETFGSDPTIIAIREAKEEMVKLRSCDDIEKAHALADNILCNLLCKMGAGGVVKEFNEIEKFYA